MTHIFLTTIFSLLVACRAWTPFVFKQTSLRLLLSSTGIPNEIDDGYWSDEFEDDPCWQNIYDDDCAMSNANLAFFKASVWVKGMPCAQGIEDCDMPEALQVPEVRPHKQIDVMEFLNLKRAKHIGDVSDDEPGKDATGP